MHCSKTKLTLNLIAARMPSFFALSCGMLSLSMNCTTKEANPKEPDLDNRLSHNTSPHPYPSKSAAPPAEARIQSKLQNEILERSALVFGQDHGELFMLMSQSSWADQGQIWLTAKDYSHNDRSVSEPQAVEFHFLAPAQKDLSKATSRTLTKDEINKVWPELEATKALSDYEPKVLDGMQYEFVQVRWQQGESTQVHLIYMNNPGLEESLAHNQLIQSLRGLISQ